MDSGVEELPAGQGVKARRGEGQGMVTRSGRKEVTELHV